MQSIHEDYQRENHQLDITIVCDSLESPANVGGVLRLADAYGVSKVIFLRGVDEFTQRAKSVSRGTQKFVDFTFANEFDFDDREWFCLELATDSKPLVNFKLESNKIGVIIGNERSGVREEFLSRFSSYHIKMFGNNSSMNVTSALSGALYQITQ